MGCCNSNPTKENTSKPKVSHKHQEPDTSKQLNLFHSDQDIKEHYKFLKILGRGALGSIYLVEHRVMKEQRVCRVVPLDVLDFYNIEKTFKRDLLKISNLDHINLLTIFDIYEDSENYYVVSELAKGGPLYDQITESQWYSEYNAALVMKHILSAVSHLHMNGITHRDIRSENIMLETNKIGDYSVKLNSFNACVYNSNPQALKAIVDSPYYMAPEVLLDIVTPKSDIWGCGVILYILLCGYPPFKGKLHTDVEVAIESGIIDFNSIEWDQVSEEAKNFIRRLLEYDPEKRIDAETALQDPWLVNKLKEYETKDKSEFIKLNSFETLKNFNGKTKLQHACIAFLIHQISCNEQTKHLRKIFSEMDVSGEGKLSVEELRDGYKKYFSKNKKFSQEEFENIILNFSQENKNYIEYEDFLRATVDMDTLLTEKNLKLAFSYFDKDGSGEISAEEIKNALGLTISKTKEEKNSSTAVVKAIMNEVDASGDGLISYDEFKELMMKTIKKK